MIGTHVFVHLDEPVTVIGDFQVFAQLYIGLVAHRKDHGVGFQGLFAFPGCYADGFHFPFTPDLLHAMAGEDPDPSFHKDLLGFLCQVGVKGQGQDVGLQFHQGHILAGLLQLVRHFDADKAGSDDHDLMQSAELLFHFIQVNQVLGHRIYIIQISTLEPGGDYRF